MGDIGTYVIYLVMACALAGAVASLFNDEEGLGKEFLEGFRAIGHIFIPVAGIMASIPYLSALIKALFGPVFTWIGADPAMAATSIIAVDMGGYQLADSLAGNRESWIMAMVTGYMAGATIVFSIPVGLAMLDKKDHRYMALGVLSGILSVPVGVLVTCLILLGADLSIREVVHSSSVANYKLQMSLKLIFVNLAPLVAFVVAIAAGLWFVPRKMIKGFMIFGKGMDALIKLVLVFSVIEYFTGAFTKILGSWGFDPIIADSKDQFRALEIAGYIGIMLSGAFPMVYLIKKYFSKFLNRVGEKVGLQKAGAAGIFATTANILAMYRLVGEMQPKDKVLNIAFAVCAAFLFGDHLAFTANFQPSLVGPIMIGKLAGGAFAFVLAKYISIPKIRQISR